MNVDDIDSIATVLGFYALFGKSPFYCSQFCQVTEFIYSLMARERLEIGNGRATGIPCRELFDLDAHITSYKHQWA